MAEGIAYESVCLYHEIIGKVVSFWRKIIAFIRNMKEIADNIAVFSEYKKKKPTVTRW